MMILRDVKVKYGRGENSSSVILVFVCMCGGEGGLKLGDGVDSRVNGGTV